MFLPPHNSVNMGYIIFSGKLLGCFIGKCSGSIRSVTRHPELPVIASCGLDSYLRLWDIKTRQPLSAVFLKQHLTNVVFDSNFVDKVLGVLAEIAATAQNVDGIQTTEIQTEDEMGTLPMKRKKASKEKREKKKKPEVEEESAVMKSKEKSQKHKTENGEVEEESTVVKSKKKSRKHKSENGEVEEESAVMKSKKKSRKHKTEIDEVNEESAVMKSKKKSRKHKTENGGGA
ncbi:hypothetical protein OIU77_007549 [Salix suchowensis]|uniref:Transducin/WD40 repeat-like superfamily protein n=1 Tax=Salix suchowensis TaxID=1278906 RepID=A0ABQ9AHC2_9ROSI|nr:hypothetical protein OIU77_007549 [Salix suchowensis]